MYAVGGMLLLAIAMSGFAWWWNLGRGSRCIEFWGPNAARSIRVTQRVEVFELALEGAEETAVLSIGDRKLPILRQKEISGLRGLIHARNSLLEDSSFRWADSPPSSPIWKYALRWTDDQQQQVTVLFSLDDGCISAGETQKKVRLTDFSTKAWTKVLPRYLEEPVQPAPHVP
jgi:hypothetical protein